MGVMKTIKMILEEHSDLDEALKSYEETFGVADKTLKEWLAEQHHEFHPASRG